MPHLGSLSRKIQTCIHIHLSFILWLNVPSCRSLSLPCQLICCWRCSHLHSQSQMCPQGTMKSTLLVNSGSHKEPRLHQYSHITPFCCATNQTPTAREASDRGCVITQVANTTVLSGFKGLFSFLPYLMQQQHACEKFITEMYHGNKWKWICVYLHVCMGMRCVYPHHR